MRSPASLRLFIALWPPDHVRNQVAQWQAQWTWPERAGVVKPERLHATLHFLGDVAPDTVRDLRYVLGRVASQGFTLHFGHGEMWQHGTAVLRPDNSPTALRGLQARIGLALVGIGVRVEDRPYKPHVTLARRAQGASAPQRNADFDWESRGGFVLVQTLPGGRGYQVLETFGA